jgi:glycosyltransferase involved in cell wall biosynthesis
VRIGLVVPGFSADASDWCIPALRHLARSLASKDEVRVFAVRYPYRAARYTIDGSQVTALGGGLSHGARTLELWRDTLRVLRAEHLRRPFDVLHAFWATESGLLAALAGRVLGVPTLVSLAGGELVALREIDYGDQRLAGERLKIAASLRLATHVTAGSDLLRRRAERHLHDRRRVHVAPLGVELSLFTPSSSVAAHQRRVVHVGTLMPVKDQATLLRAFSLVHHQLTDACLEIVGDGPLAADLRRMAASLGIESSVKFRGEIDHAALPAIYRDASACVVSSRHEAQCMVALEAAACGVPLAGTRVGVVPELTNAVAPIGDHQALAQVIVATLCGSDQGAAGLATTFGLEPCAERFRALYANHGGAP